MRFYDAYLRRSRYNVKFQTKAHMKMRSEYVLEIILKKMFVLFMIYKLEFILYFSK